MELKWLEDFISLAETGSFSHSADKRFITQSGFSRRIKSLETWLGVTLVDRSTYPTQLTPAGKKFRHMAEDIITTVYGVRDSMQKFDKGPLWVAFAAPSSIASRFFPDWLEKIKPDCSDIHVRMVSASLFESAQTFINGRVDFLIAYAHGNAELELPEGRFEWVCVGSEVLIPVCKQANGKPVFDLENVNGSQVPYLSYGRESQLGGIVENMIATHSQHRFEQVYENTMADALRGMALVGEGIAWVPASLVVNDLNDAKLTICGGASWRTNLDVRVYKPVQSSNQAVTRIWDAAQKRQTVQA